MSTKLGNWHFNQFLLEKTRICTLNLHPNSSLKQQVRYKLCPLALGVSLCTVYDSCTAHARVRGLTKTANINDSF